MKIKSLKLKNFAKFVDFEAEFDGQVTRLVGVNGSGKTTVGMTAIWAALKGIAERGQGVIGERFRFIGTNKKSADIELTLVDEKREGAKVVVRNHITAASNEITFSAPENYEISTDWLNGLLSVAFMSAKNFCSMSSREQAVALGIDVSDIDKSISKLKQEFTLLNRDLKTIGAVVEVLPVEKENISDLVRQKDEIDLFNMAQSERAAAITKANANVTQAKLDVDVLRQRLEVAEKKLDDAVAESLALPQPEDRQSTAELVARIHGTEETNRKADEYARYIDRKARADAKQAEIDQNRHQLEIAQNSRLERISSHSFGFDGLSVDDEGGLLLNGRPIKEPYFSRGEQEIIVARLHASVDPELKIRFLDDFETFDEDNQARVVDELLAAGFQVITAEVGKRKEKENTILLRECRVVGEYAEQTKLL